MQFYCVVFVQVVIIMSHDTNITPLVFQSHYRSVLNLIKWRASLGKIPFV